MEAKSETVLEVVLYGAPHCGYGWYAVGPADLSGGRPLPSSGRKCYGEGGQSCYCISRGQAVHEGLKALKTAGAPKGATVYVVSPKGRYMRPAEAL